MLKVLEEGVSVPSKDGAVGAQALLLQLLLTHIDRREKSILFYLLI